MGIYQKLMVLGFLVDFSTSNDHIFNSFYDLKCSGDSKYPKNDRNFDKICSVNRVKSVKRSESLLSRFSFIFPQETEKLADILVEEFKKNDQSNGLAMERMFRKADPSALVEVNGFNIFIKPHVSPVMVL